MKPLTYKEYNIIIHILTPLLLFLKRIYNITPTKPEYNTQPKVAFLQNQHKKINVDYIYTISSQKADFFMKKIVEGYVLIMALFMKC
ncbi:MAG: hypothetical protein BZ136_03880 [Methanosphaera sp. rholeuAM74]|nr:MAG: hypothetical protein BZ136_03880 [Methanosphaera sp. rholeuAM74]